jgi:uncharacterized protein YacL
MSNKIIRGFFIFACLVLGGLWALNLVDVHNAKVNEEARVLEQSTPAGQPVPESVLEPIGSPLPWILFGSMCGGAVAVFVLILLRFITQELFERISPALAAIILAMVVGFFLSNYILMFWPTADENIRLILTTTLVLVFGFIGITLGLTRASSWEALVRAVHRRHGGSHVPKLVDTSVIIDGRLAEICMTGFVEGELLVPRFVLKELQGIADSSDELKRARGRRGLDILRALHEPDIKVTITVIEDDPVDIKEVDGKLVYLARECEAKILTNDLNLNKVAQIEGVQILNINDLANALKPAVLPDENMRVRVIKEGKEAQQGVGYLDDGTMIVVDGGRNHVGKDVEVVVTSVLQTTAGRMIFTKLHRVAS